MYQQAVTVGGHLVYYSVRKGNATMQKMHVSSTVKVHVFSGDGIFAHL
jgi:hypothetical protein